MTYLSAVSLATAVLASGGQEGAITAPLSRDLAGHASARTILLSDSERFLGLGVVITSDGLAIAPGDVVFNSTGRPRTALRATRNGVAEDARVVAFDPSTDVALVALPAKGNTYAYAEPAENMSGRVVLVMLQEGPARGFVAATGAAGVMALTGRYMPLNEIRLDSGGKAPTGAPVFLPDGKLVGMISGAFDSGQSRVRAAPAVEAPAIAPSGFAAKIGPTPATTFSLDLPVLRRIVDGYRSSDKSIDHPWVGLFFKTNPEREQGALITEVVPNSPGATAGIKVGDVVIGTTVQPFFTHVEFAAYLFARKPDETVTLTVNRDGRSRNVQIRLAREPHATNQLVRAARR